MTSTNNAIIGEPEVVEDLAEHPAWLRLKASVVELRELLPFCPGCGGNKARESTRCANCRNAQHRAERADARAHGVVKRGFRPSAPPTQTMVMENRPEMPSTASIARGRGAPVTRRQAPPPMYVKAADGKWIAPVEG